MLPSSPAERMLWILKDTPQGPYSAEQIFERWQGGEFPADISACVVGDQNWLPLWKIADFSSRIPPPVLSGSASPVVSDLSPVTAPNSNPNIPFQPTAQETHPTARFPRWLTVLAVSFVIGISTWLAMIVAERIWPGPERIARKCLDAETAIECKKYATARMYAVIDSIFADKTPSNPNDNFEITTTVDGPTPQIKIVGIRGSIFIADAGRRVVIEGHLRVIKDDGWKVDDFVVHGMEGFALEGPVSLIDMHNAELAARKAATPAPNPIQKSLSLSGEPNKLKVGQKYPSINPPSLWERLTQDWKKTTLYGLILLSGLYHVLKSSSGKKND